MTKSDQNEDDVRARAYQLWQESGSPDGKEDEFWYRARAEAFQPTLDNDEKPESADEILNESDNHYPPTNDSTNFA